jgi:hypothetical protein
MTPRNGHGINPPTFARASVVAGHSPTQSTSAGCLDRWQIHHACDETTGVAAPRLTTSNWAASIAADGAVVSAPHKSAARYLLKCVSAVSTELQYTAIETEIGINVRSFKVEIVPERQLRATAFKKGEKH